MIINIGDDKYILTRNIVAILDRGSMENNKVFKEFINRLRERGSLYENVSREELRSYIVLEGDQGTEVYGSKISAGTLERRSNINRWR